MYNVHCPAWLQPAASPPLPVRRGHFTRTKPGPTFLSPATPYIASHDTDPPASQVIKSDPTSILVRALQSRKEEAKRKQGGKAAGASATPSLCWGKVLLAWPCRGH